MAVTNVMLAALNENTRLAVSRNEATWTKFLDFSCRFSKYAFDDQILIYGQNPQATAVAPMHTWNKHMDRKIKKGSKGIALFDNTSNKTHYVFDYADTEFFANKTGKDFITARFEGGEDLSFAITSLEKTYGRTNDTLSHAERIFAVAESAVDDSFPEILEDLKENVEGSFLAKYDEDELEAVLRSTLTSSVAYSVAKKAGVDVSELNLDFSHINEFDTTDSISCIGRQTADLANPIINDLSKSFWIYRRRELQATKERRTEHGADLSTGRGLSGAEHRAGEHAGRHGTDEVRVSAEEVSGGTQTDALHADAAERDVLPSSSTDSGRSGHDVEPSDRGAGESPGRERGIEDERSNEMGRDDEQHPGISGGNSPERTYLQLSLFPSEQEQEEIHKGAEIERFSAFNLPKDNLDADLMRGSQFEGGKMRIYALYQHEESAAERAKFLQKEYGLGGHSFQLMNGESGFVDYRGKGVLIHSFRSEFEERFTWREAEKRIKGLIDNGMYLNDKDKDTWAALETKYAAVGGVPYPNPAYRMPEPIEVLMERNKDVTVTFTVAESSEFHSAGFYSDDYTSLTSAIDMFHTLRNESDLNGIPALGIKIHKNGADERDDSQWDFVVGNRLDLSGLNYLPEMADNEVVRFALKELSELFPEEESLDDISESALDDTSVPFRAWEITSNSVNGDMMYSIYRLMDDTKTDYSGNREYPTGYSADRATIEFLVSELNRLEINEIEEATAFCDRYYEEKREQEADFHIEDEHLGEGGAKEKFKRNMAAIYLLKTLENEGREATAEEKAVLSQYVGWGGLADAFDSDKRDWALQYQELEAALTEDEYKAARASTLNAHYTSPTVVNAIYDALSQMGFQGGTVLEPSCGVGNFFGMMPEAMRKNSNLYGVELDSITGRIAQKLYPEAQIEVKGFEKTDFANNSFDVAIGNVPFGNYKVNDKAYNHLNYNIHNYFFAKSLDQVRPGGIVAFVTSRYTMDSVSPEVRKHLAQRADLLGAIRLPNNAFKANAGTEVVSDIIFLQKRDRPIEIEPDWIHTDTTEDGLRINSYFNDHPEMILGTVASKSTQYGHDELTVEPIDGVSLAEQLKAAIPNIHGSIGAKDYAEYDITVNSDDVLDVIPASPDVKNYSFALRKSGDVYYRENDTMRLMDDKDGRLRELVRIRNCARRLIEEQLEDVPDEQIAKTQEQLNLLYDDFQNKYGLINSRANKKAFEKDSSYALLCSLENLDTEGNFIGKAAMFTKRTISKREVVTHCDTPSQALAVSLAEKACVDLPFMSELTDLDEEQIIADLQGVIFRNPLYVDNPSLDQWLTAEEYLSGDVREKLGVARAMAENDASYALNVAELEQVIPKDLDASEISAHLGATWIKPEYINDFMHEVLGTRKSMPYNNAPEVLYTSISNVWRVEGKKHEYGNTLVHETYGTSRMNALELLELTLNLKTPVIRDRQDDGSYITNKNETMLIQQKQEALKEAFKSWVFEDPDRREDLVRTYNDRFNSIRPREYDGSHMTFPGINPEITLKPHQVNAVARMVYGDNTLLAHCVGAGKTFEMTAAAMEQKRLGLCKKSLIVVPNHLTEQWAHDFMQLYPGADILAATKKDFEPANRKKFCSRIATGDYDAVIIGHSQFEKIPLSKERQERFIEEQINEITEAMEEMKYERDSGAKFSVKQMEKMRKSLEAKLEKLSDIKQDDVVTFEELGVDRLFVDESHYYKNLYLHTKMQNVAGIGQSEAMKSSDMFAKCRYMDEITSGKGTTFATGTPISNSMTEMFTNMRYLQNDMLERRQIKHFDQWAATFGETVTGIELAPEGTGYRSKTRFSSFNNLPELISLFKEAADIQMPDMLDLDVPEAEYINVQLKPDEYQKLYVKALGERADNVRSGMVDPSVDNMLKITTDGRKVALDPRLLDADLPDNPHSKANACVENVVRIYNETAEQKSTQLIFCDQSTPKGDGSFNVYDDVKQKLIAQGVAEHEIAFIHDAKTELQKDELFQKVRRGDVRVLLGSTQKMGAGTNVQTKLIALHHLDVPWRPADIEQQEGRIIRQYNENKHVQIFRYVTEGTFDAYSWQVIENKQKFISQIMTSKAPVRSCQDMDAAVLSAAEVKALAVDNPLIKEKMELDVDVTKLKLLKANHTQNRYKLQDKIAKDFPQKIAYLEKRISQQEKDIAVYKSTKHVLGDNFSIKIEDTVYTDKKDVQEALRKAYQHVSDPGMKLKIGEYMGFDMQHIYDVGKQKHMIVLKGAAEHYVETGENTVVRLDNVLKALPAEGDRLHAEMGRTKELLETAKIEVDKPFEKEGELASKTARLNELDILLNADNPVESEVSDLLGWKEYTKLFVDKAGFMVSNIEKDDILTTLADVRTENYRDVVDALKDAGASVTILLTGNDELSDDCVVYDTTERTVTFPPKASVLGKINQFREAGDSGGVDRALETENTQEEVAV